MKRKLRSSLLMVLDIVLINLSLLAAYILRFEVGFDKVPEQYLKNLLTVAVIATIVKLLFFMVFRLYGSLWRYAGAHELVTILLSAFVSNMVMLTLVLFSHTHLPAYMGIFGDALSKFSAPRSIFIVTFFIDVCLIGGIRFTYRAVRRIARGDIIRFKNAKRVMIIGGGDAGAIIVRELIHNPQLKNIPVAIIDDDELKVGRKINNVPIMGTSRNIVKVAEKKDVDEIIITIPSAHRKDINRIYSECTKTSCKIKILPSVSQLINESVTIQKVRDVDIEDLLGREPVCLDCEEISLYLEDKVVLVTGGGGSIGSELCRQIAGFGPRKLVILDNYENNLFETHNELVREYSDLEIVPVVASIREKTRLYRIFGEHRPHVVFHAAAHKHVPLMEANPTEAIKNNVFGTMNVAECAETFEAERFVLISTDKAVNPTNIMGATKRVAEMIIQAIDRHSKTDFVAVRFGNVLGSNGSVIPLFKKQIEQGGPVTVTHADVIRYFMTIPEAAQLVLQAGGMANGGEIFVLDMGEPVKICDLARNLIKLSGFEPDEDIEIVYTGLRPGEKLYEELLMDEEGLTSTKNNKIFVARPMFSDFGILKREINQLRETLLGDADSVIEYMMHIVPTYQKANRE